MEDLLERKKKLVDYFQKMVSSSEHNAEQLLKMKERGFSDSGMLEKVIKVTAIQSRQIRELATIALYVINTDKFTSDLAISMVMEHEEEKI